MSRAGYRYLRGWSPGRRRSGNYVTPIDEGRDPYGGHESRGACARCGHDEDDHHDLDRPCAHRARLTMPDPYRPGEFINYAGGPDCACPGFVPPAVADNSAA